jgi:hypothetical protein
VTCQISKLSVLAYANGFTLWHYRTDTPEDVVTRDFFGSVRDMLTAGDMVLASGAGGGKLVCLAGPAGALQAGALT